jgi:RHS repeat-associated protein
MKNNFQRLDMAVAKWHRRHKKSHFDLLRLCLACWFFALAIEPQPALAHHVYPLMPAPGATCAGPIAGSCPCGSSGCTSSNCFVPDDATHSIAPGTTSDAPVYYSYGSAIEHVTDITLSAGGIDWSISRTFFTAISGSANSFSQGVNWSNSSADLVLYQADSSINLLAGAGSLKPFTGTGPVYTSPADTYLLLTHDTTNSQFILTNQTNNMRWTFYDFSVTPSTKRGLLKEQSTLQLFSQGKSGFVYSYTSAGMVNQITTPSGQDYNIVFTYNTGAYITQIQVQDASGTVLQQVNYTYYATGDSSDVGVNNDLVQVQVSTRATADSGSTLSIVRYTHYRYTNDYYLSAVYENDAIQRVLASTGLSSPSAMLTEPNSYGTPAIQSFATKSFTYYGSGGQPSTSNVNTPFAANENLTTEYQGAADVTAVNYVASETIGGCGSCGTGGSVTKTYHYLLGGATGEGTLVVEDTQDSTGSGIYRIVYLFDTTGRVTRRAFIQNPTTSPIYWCESWILSSTYTGRVTEHRMPSAHTCVTTASALRAFLNPLSGSDDAATVNSSSGLIYVFSYNSSGLRTDEQIKDGESGTAYWTSATDYGDGINPALVTATYDYPTETTTRSNGKQTSYSYTFYDTSTHQQIKSKTTTLPAISTGQNGSGVATTKTEYYDNLGRLRWAQDGEGYINYYSYHPVMGTLAYEAVDVDPSNVSSDISGGSSGNWEAWTVDGANSNVPTRSASLPTPLALVTKTYYDELGRRTQVTDGGGNNHYTVYANLQTIMFPFWNSGTSQSLVPIQVTNLNNGAKVSDQIGVRASYTAISTSSGAPTGFSTAPSQSDYVTWTHFTYDPNTGFLTYTDRYIDSPSSGSGTLSTDFYRTITQYDTRGRKQYVVQIINGSVITSELEQVTQYVYDVRDRMIQVNRGVSPSGANMGSNYTNYPTLYTISQIVYDSGGVGDGYVTKKRTFFGTSSTSYTGINFYRTYRGHARGIEPFYVSGSTETPIGPYTVNDVDWKGRTTTTAQYSADPTWSSVLTGDGYPAYASSTSTNRLTQNATLYDDLGRVYQLQQYDIAPASGTGTNYLAQNAYYDRNDRVLASAPAYAAGTEIAYDGAGRRYETRTVIALQAAYSSGVYRYCAPTPSPTLSSMSGGSNGVLQLAHQTLDLNGNVLETDAFEDNHDDVIISSPGINLTTNNNYVRRTTFNWYDAANRLTTIADYGSGDTSSGAGQWKYATIPSRPSSAPTASANTALVTLNAYTSDSGLLQAVTDPAGTVTKYFYDNLGRKTYVAQNWQSFVPPNTGTGNPNDRVTQYLYYGPMQLQQLVAMDPNGDGSLSDNQVTTYQYLDPVDANRPTSEVYPDSSTVTFSYNVDGSLSQKTDPRGVVLSYAYTNNRLLATESATTLPSGVDGTIQSIAHTYDNLNRPLNITSYSGIGGTGSPANDIQYAYYDAFNKVASSYQEHYGAVSTSTSLNVQHTYDTTTTGSIYSNQLRLLTDVHPNGRSIYYDYGGSSSTTAAYSANSTVREIWDGSPSGTALAVYDYNGAGSRLAIASYPQPSLKLDHFEGTSGTYAGLDRFGRIVDQYWAGFGGVSDVDRIHYAYDYTGNRLYRQIDAAIYPTENMDQAYTFDGLHRLLTSQVGTLSGTTISGTPVSQESWTLDGLGNWAGYTKQAAATTTLNQTRTASPANELSGMSASVGATWATPAYDTAGNMTTIPIPTNLTLGYTAIYDAWSRMVSLASGSTTIATYAYDGLNRRVTKGVYIGGSLDHNEDAYFNESWQLLEVRKTLSGTINSNPLEQYVWHQRYIDAPVLRDYDAATSGAPTRYYYTFDANYNVTAATSTSGVPAERYLYSPYGALTFLGGSFNVLGTQQSQIGNSLTYTGRQYDAESGLYYYRQRFYHGALGCFLSRDRIEYNNYDGNLYQYATSNPVILTDPFGTFAWVPITCLSCGICMGLPLLVCLFECVNDPTWDKPCEGFKSCYGKCLAAATSPVSSTGYVTVCTAACATCGICTAFPVICGAGVAGGGAAGGGAGGAGGAGAGGAGAGPIIGMGPGPVGPPIIGIGPGPLMGM